MGKRIDLTPWKEEIIERYEGGESAYNIMDFLYSNCSVYMNRKYRRFMRYSNIAKERGWCLR
jgi:hypothetical protein